jgi:hypothetical protein
MFRGIIVNLVKVLKDIPTINNVEITLRKMQEKMRVICFSITITKMYIDILIGMDLNL